MMLEKGKPQTQSICLFDYVVFQAVLYETARQRCSTIGFENRDDELDYFANPSTVGLHLAHGRIGG